MMKGKKMERLPHKIKNDRDEEYLRFATASRRQNIIEPFIGREPKVFFH